MAFIVEDGSIVLLANSFAAVADADAYFADRNPDSAWNDLATTEKEDALVRGTDYINTTYRLRWKGNKRAGDQALTFPRENVVDEDGWHLNETIMPPALLNATAEMALALQDPDTDPYAIDRTLSPVKSLTEKVDVIEVSTEFMDASQAGRSALSGQVRVSFEQAKVWLTYLTTSRLNGRVDRG